MVRKIYKRFGLRRDQNFGDLPDTRSALNNLLDGLVTVGGDTFVSEDLDPIRNINNIGLNNSQNVNIVKRNHISYNLKFDTKVIRSCIIDDNKSCILK